VEGGRGLMPREGKSMMTGFADNKEVIAPER
jgi:hypothetical protein